MDGWPAGIDVALTVCDLEGRIVDMNDKSARTFEKYGGVDLIGASLLDCHPEPARSKLLDLLARPRTNAYTIEKNGVRKLIYQTPWFQDGVPAGLVEMSLELPPDMPHHIRSSQQG